MLDGSDSTGGRAINGLPTENRTNLSLIIGSCPDQLDNLSLLEHIWFFRFTSRRATGWKYGRQDGLLRLEGWFSVAAYREPLRQGGLQCKIMVF
jgi:hypothetical protein